jgi:hypothetical protein
MFARVSGTLNAHMSLMSDVHVCRFAICCGGPTYERTCLRTVKLLSAIESPELLTSNGATTQAIVAMTRTPTFQNFDLENYINDLMKCLGCFSPVTGLLEVDFDASEAYVMYVADRAEEQDAIGIASETAFYRIWRQVVSGPNISARDRKTVTKCDECIGLRAKLQQVNAMIWLTFILSQFHTVLTLG